MKPLFIPVKSQVYEWYFSGKSWEVRPYRKLYNEKTVFKGRDVTVSKGYTKTRFSGVIDTDPVIGTLEKILVFVSYNEVIPDAISASDVREAIRSMTNAEKYIAFRIKKNSE